MYLCYKAVPSLLNFCGSKNKKALLGMAFEGVKGGVAERFMSPLSKNQEAHSVA